MAGTNGGFSPLPQYQGNYLQLQQQQALAQALMQQSLQAQPLPQAVGSGGSQNYQIVPKYSAVSGLEGLGKALIGARMQNAATQGYTSLMQQQINSLTGDGQQAQQAQQSQSDPTTDAGGMAAGSDGSGAGVQSTPVPTPGQPSPQALASALAASGNTQAAQSDNSSPQISNNPPIGGGSVNQTPSAPLRQAGSQGAGLLAPGTAMNPSGMDAHTAAWLYTQLGPEKYSEQYVAPFVKPTDSTLAGRQAGFTPQQIQAANAGHIAKDNFVAPLTGTGIMRNPFNPSQPVAFNPDVPAGTTPLFDASGNVARVQPIQGAQAAMQGNAAASAAGAAQYGLTQVYDPNYVDPNTGQRGGMVQQTVANVANGANRPSGGIPPIPTVPTPPGMSAPSGSGQPPPLPPGMGGQQAPQGSSSGFAAAPPMGAPANADAAARNQQDELSKKWTDLTAANQQAQTTTSYLQNIKSLAGQAATGQQADRLNYVNGLLSLAGSDKATDAVTANNLLDKYSNQITARLSANGMGTDSARAILQSAYPNSHMTPAAINEAADNLVGANQMTQAKAALLAPLANSRNASAYNNTELKFDQAADPRLWQLQNMQPADQAKYVSTLPPQTAKMLLQNRQTLKGLGVLN